MNAAVGNPAVGFTAAQIQEARALAANSQRRFADVLEERSALGPEAYTHAVAKTLGYPVLSMAELHALEPAFDILPFGVALERGCVLFRAGNDRLLLAIGDAFDRDLHDWADARIAQSFATCLVHRTDLAAYLARHEETLRAMDSLLPDADKAGGGDVPVEDLSFKTISEDTSPVVRLVHSTLYDAFKVAASDIHLESGAAGMMIKYRVDGVLTTAGSMPGTELAEQVISRIKVMSELDIAERRVPQDGRFKIGVRGRSVDCRVSIMPSIFGEDAVVRILDKQALSDQMKGLRLSYLGFDERTVAQVRRLASEPYGMLLVTGPTGSGKTTTLYAAISEINNGQDKIITIEDPVEYQLPGVLQIPVNEKKHLTFARGLRSILRHDPDKIMVGEIRDEETAQIAIQSALTGHLVFTTVHANNVFDVIGRFNHMGVDPYSFVSAMNGIIAQRLIRVTCVHCAVEERPDDQLIADSGLSGKVDGFVFRTGRGCGHCRGTGYKGRRAIGEVLLLNDEIRELIVARAPIRTIREAAVRQGTRFLRDSAVELVRTGETNLQEINRVTLWRNKPAVALVQDRLTSGYAKARALCSRSIGSVRRGELGVALLGVVLCPDRLIITRVVGGWRRPLEHKEVIALAPAPPDAPRWQPALEALAGKVLAGALSGADVTLVLSNHFVHYVLVPWSELLRSEEDQLAFARERFVRVHGSLAESWLLRLSQASPRQPRLACGVDKALIDALDAVMVPVSSHYRSLQPYLMASFNHWRARLGVRPGWFVVAEPGLLCLALLKDGQWQSVRTIRLGPDWPNELSGALAREQYLVESQTESEHVLVYAPDLPAVAALETGNWKIENLQV